MIGNIDTKKIDEIENEENITKAQVDKNETNDQKIKNLIKQWLAKKFNKKISLIITKIISIGLM